MRLLIVCLGGLVIYCQYLLWFGDNGYFKYQAAAKQVAELSETHQRFLLRNQQMQAEVDDLARGGRAVEERARTELEFVKPDEVFYRIIPKK